MIDRFLTFISSLQSKGYDKSYPFIVAALAALDLFILVVPTDALLISAVFLKPRRWISISLVVAFGSALGALALAGIAADFPNHLPQALTVGADGGAWEKTRNIFEHYGFWALTILSISPVPQQPGVVIAGLSQVPLWDVFASVFLGRIVKYLLFSYLATYAPDLLTRFKSLRKEMETIPPRKSGP